jgi:hypothetical protein
VSWGRSTVGSAFPLTDWTSPCPTQAGVRANDWRGEQDRGWRYGTGPSGYVAAVRARRSRLLAPVVLVLLVAGCTDDPQPAARGPLTQPLPPPGETPGPRHDVAVARADLDAAQLEVVSGSTSVTVRDADLGGDLVRARTPEDSQVAPAVSVDGSTVRVSLASTGLSGPADLTVLLDRQVRWRVQLSGGASSEVLDLRGGRVDGVDLTAGANRIELSLPAPRGAVPIRMSGGASDFTVHLPADVDAGVRVGGGAGSVMVDGVRKTGLSGGTTVASTHAADRYDIEATAGVSSLTVDRS